MDKAIPIFLQNGAMGVLALAFIVAALHVVLLIHTALLFAHLFAHHAVKVLHCLVDTAGVLSL